MAARQLVSAMILLMIGERIIAPTEEPAKVIDIAVPLALTNQRVSITAIGTVVQNELPNPIMTARAYNSPTFWTKEIPI